MIGIWMETVVAYFKVLCRIWPRETEKNKTKILGKDGRYLDPDQTSLNNVYVVPWE